MRPSPQLLKVLFVSNDYPGICAKYSSLLISQAPFFKTIIIIIIINIATFLAQTRAITTKNPIAGYPRAQYT